MEQTRIPIGVNSTYIQLEQVSTLENRPHEKISASERERMNKVLQESERLNKIYVKLECRHKCEL